MITLLLAAIAHLTLITIISIITRPWKMMTQLQNRINSKIVFGALSVLIVVMIDYLANTHYMITVGLGFILSLLISIKLSIIDAFLGTDLNYEYKGQPSIKTHHYYRLILNLITISLLIISLLVFKISLYDDLIDMFPYQVYLWMLILFFKIWSIYLERHDAKIIITTVGDGSSLFLTEFDEFPMFKIEKTLPLLPLSFIEKKFSVIENPRFVGIFKVKNRNHRYVLYVFESRDKVNVTFYPRKHLPDSYIDHKFHAFIRDITKERRMTYKKRFVARVHHIYRVMVSASVRYIK